MSEHTWILAPISSHQLVDWNTEKTVGKLPYQSLVLLAVTVLTVLDPDLLLAFSLRSTRFGQSHAKCSPSPHVTQAPLAIVVFFFLKVVVLTGLLAAFPLFLLCGWFFYTMLALEWPSPPFLEASLARASSSTLRDAIRLSTDISSLMFQSNDEVPSWGGQLCNHAPCQTRPHGTVHMAHFS
jgi:hypothetical protein